MHKTKEIWCDNQTIGCMKKKCMLKSFAGAHEKKQTRNVQLFVLQSKQNKFNWQNGSLKNEQKIVSGPPGQNELMDLSNVRHAGLIDQFIGE